MNPLTLPTHPRIVHPRTGEPIQAIAISPRTGAPVWPIMGGDGSEDDKNDWSKVFAGKTAEQVKSELDAAVKAKGTGGDDSQWTKLFGDQTPDQVKEKLENSRKWEDRAKDNKDKAGVLATLLETLGVKPEEAKPEELKQTIGTLTNDNKSTRIENAVLKRNAVKNGETTVQVDAQALSDSRTFMDAAAKLDPAADDFQQKLDEQIVKFVTDNPRYQAQSTTTRPAPVKQQGQQSEGKPGGVAAGGALFEETRTKRPATAGA